MFFAVVHLKRPTNGFKTNANYYMINAMDIKPYHYIIVVYNSSEESNIYAWINCAFLCEANAVNIGSPQVEKEHEKIT